jgi:hypothetical protein
LSTQNVHSKWRRQRFGCSAAPSTDLEVMWWWPMWSALPLVASDCRIGMNTGQDPKDLWLIRDSVRLVQVGFLALLYPARLVRCTRWTSLVVCVGGGLRCVSRALPPPCCRERVDTTPQPEGMRKTSKRSAGEARLRWLSRPSASHSTYYHSTAKYGR